MTIKKEHATRIQVSLKPDTHARIIKVSKVNYGDTIDTLINRIIDKSQGKNEIN